MLFRSLAAHRGVGAVVVVRREDVPGDERLVAYVVPEDSSPTVEALYTHLKRELPEYMLPTAFVLLEELPRTPNGKLNRAALPTPQEGAYLSRQYEAPQGELEETLARIWRGVLQVERIGRHDNFFELGGHSLILAKVSCEIAERFHIQVPLCDVFRAPTFDQMARHVDVAVRLCTATKPELEEGFI